MLLKLLLRVLLLLPAPAAEDAHFIWACVQCICAAEGAVDGADEDAADGAAEGPADEAGGEGEKDDDLVAEAEEQARGRQGGQPAVLSLSASPDG